MTVGAGDGTALPNPQIAAFPEVRRQGELGTG